MTSALTTRSYRSCSACWTSKTIALRDCGSEHGTGNVRELENTIEWAISMGATPYILPEDLPKELTANSDGPVTGRLYDSEFEDFQRSLFARDIARERRS